MMDTEQLASRTVNRPIFDGDNYGLQLGTNYGHINNHFYQRPTGSLPPTSFFNVPYPRDRKFIPRQPIFDEINELVSDGIPVALCGLGGTGKSQIAIEYAYRFQDQYQDQCFVIWIYADSTESVLWALQNLAQKLQLLDQWIPKSDRYQPLADWFEKVSLDSQTRWLIILDNFDSSTVLDRPLHSTDSTQPDSTLCHKTMREYLPFTKCRDDRVILMTTRSHDVAASVGDNNIVDVTTLSPGDARALFDTKMSRITQRKQQDDPDENDAHISNLLDKLGHVPLAVTQAAAFIKRNRVSPSQYLEILEKGDHHLASYLHTELQDPRRQVGWPNSIFRTWKLSFDFIKDTDSLAGELLSLAAFLNGNNIPTDLLSQMVSSSTSSITTSFGTLFGHALFHQRADSNDLSIHPLVQTSVRHWIREAEEAGPLVKRASNVVKNAMDSKLWGDYEKAQTMMSHAERLLSYEEIQGHEYQASLLYSRACYQEVLGLYAEAWVDAKSAFDLQLAKFGKEAPETLKTSNLLGKIAKRRGQYEKAEKIHRRTLIVAKRALGEEHPETLASMGNLAFVLRIQGRTEQAEEISRKVLMNAPEVLGTDHPDTLAVMKCLAHILGDHGKALEAEEMYRRVLSASIRSLGPKHPDTLAVMNSLAGVLQEQGKNEEAERTHRETLATLESTFGLDHPATSASAWNLAYLLLTADHSNKEGRQLLEGAVNRFTKHLGPDHPQTRSCQRDLEVFLSRQCQSPKIRSPSATARQRRSSDDRERFSSAGDTSFRSLYDGESSIFTSDRDRHGSSSSRRPFVILHGSEGSISGLNRSMDLNSRRHR